MNYLVFRASHCSASDQIEVSGSQAKKLIKEHDLSEGISVKCVVYGRFAAQAQVLHCSPDLLRVTVSGKHPGPEKTTAKLVVGLCRPQTVKKVISAATALGVSAVDFVKFSKSEKSYLDSKIWQDAELQQQNILAMSQTGDVSPVIIRQFASFRQWQNSQEFVSDTPLMIFDSRGSEPKHLTGETICQERQNYIFGPESGFTSEEVETLSELSDQTSVISLGQRFMRLEQAIMASHYLIAR